MKHLLYLAWTCILTCSQLVFAADNVEHHYTEKETIAFASATKRAFDRSGKSITHIKRADGSSMTDHNGSLGNVTVARLGPDGTVETYCTNDEATARAWMAGEFGRKPDNSPSLQIRVK